MIENIEVIATGKDWLGRGVGSIESALRSLFNEAEREILLTVYTITSSVDMLFDWMEMALGRGVEIKMIINRLGEQTASVRNRLQNLDSGYRHFHLYDFSPGEQVDLHAKLIVVDRRKAIVGSSNLSKRGLLTNYELAVTVQGETAANIASVVDRLIDRFTDSVINPIRKRL